MEAFIEKIEKSAGNYFRENFPLILFAVLVTFAAFGYQLVDFTLSIDEEIKSFDSSGLEWLRQGRWGTYLLLKLFMPESLIPFLPTFVSLFFLVVGAFLVFRLIDGDRISKAAFLLVFLTFPSTAFFMEFNTFNFAVSAGLASALLGALLFVKFTETRRYSFFFCSAAAVAFSIGAYQSVFSVLLCALFLFFLRKGLHDDPAVPTVKDSFAAVLLLLLSFAIYKAAALLFSNLLHAGESSYLEGFLGWTAAGYSVTIEKIGLYLRRHFTGAYFYGEKTLLVIWLVVPYIIFRIFRRRGIGSKIAGVLFLAGLLLSPFVVSIVLGTDLLPVRAVVALPLMVGGLVYLASLEAKKTVKYGLLLLSVFIALQNSFSITRLAYSGHLAYQADRDLANRILDRMYGFDIQYSSLNPVPVAIIGKRGYAPSEAFLQNEVFGASFFEWEEGNPERILYFMRLMGVEDFRIADKEQYRFAAQQSEGMKNWPDRSSVQYASGVIIVKLSDLTDMQRWEMTAH